MLVKEQRKNISSLRLKLHILLREKYKKKRFKTNFTTITNTNFFILKFIGLLDLFLYILIITLFSTVLNLDTKYSSSYFIFNSEKIALIINGTGEQNILNPEFRVCPDAIYLNNDETNNIINNSNCKTIYLSLENNETNLVQLLWNYPLYDTSSMFKDLKNILAIDLSKFNSIYITNTTMMFSGCESIVSIFFTNFNTPSLVDLRYMFYNCFSLSRFNLSFLDTSQVTDMSYLFYGCKNIYTLYLENFRTSNVKSMSFMFAECDRLASLDLSIFNTPSLTDINNMFLKDLRLKFLDISNLDTSNVVSMAYTFTHCEALAYLNLSNFDTSKVITMDNMFCYCSKLLYLDLSHFRTPNLKNMNRMFRSCYSLTSINLQNFDTSQVNTMSLLFYHCFNLVELDISSFITSNVRLMNEMFSDCPFTSINLSNFDTHSVTVMQKMFYNCSNLISIDLGNFDTRNVTYLDYMFYNCTSLISLNLSNFKTPQLIKTDYIFFNCSSLQSLDISNLDTSEITTMEGIFANCSKLKSLNLQNFVTSNVANMNSMFENCSQLTSLDLSNFDTSALQSLSLMFSGCEQLEYINFNSYNEFKRIVDIKNILYKVPENFVICINANKLITELLVKINEKSCPTIYCGNDWRDHQRKMKNNTCLDDIIETTEAATNAMTVSFSSYRETPNLESRVQTTNIINLSSYIKPDTDKLTTYETYIEKTSNLINNEKIYIYPTSVIVTEKEVIKEPSTNLNIEQTDYKKYVSTFPFYEPESETLTYETKKESAYIHVEEITNIVSTTKLHGELTFSTYISTKYNDDKTDMSSTASEKFEMSNSIISAKESIEKTEIDSTLPNKNEITHKIEKSSIINIQTTLISDLYEIIQPLNKIKIDYYENSNFTSGEINQLIYEQIINNVMKNIDDIKGNGIVIEGKNNCYYQFTTLEDERSNNFDNNDSIKFSKIDLGECEDVLRENYNLNKNISLLILKLEKLSNKSSERFLQFEVYEPINMTKLNLSLCNDISIDIYIPVKLSEEMIELYNSLKDSGYDLFDINSKFYTDFCTPYTSPDGTDILLSDRVNYIFNNEETQCQPNCKFSDYSFETQALKCDCNVSIGEITPKDNNNVGAKSIYKSFYDVLKYSNYKVLKCYKLAFSLHIFPNNKGNIITLVYFSLFLIIFFVYLLKGIDELKNDLSKNIFEKTNKEIDKEIDKDPITIHPKRKTVKNNLNNINKKNVKSLKEKSKSKSFSFRPNNIKNIRGNNDNIKLKMKDNKKGKSKKIKNNFPPKKQPKLLNNLKNNKKNDNKLLIKINNISVNSKTVVKGSSRNFINAKDIENNSVNDNKENLDNYELNNLEYEEAIKLDKRNFFRIYWSFLEREHLIFFSFFKRNDHNITIVKYARFIFLVCTDMAFNVFFFSDETMHKMYLDYGKYNFVQQIPQIVYSTLVSQILEVFLCFLSLTDKYFYEIKEIKIKSINKILQILRCIQFKVSLFFLFTGLMFLFYWYIVTCFCAVYENTQMAFIKDSLSSFGLGLLYPFILYLFPTILRIIALRCNKSNLSFVYKLSDIIPIF